MKTHEYYKKVIVLNCGGTIDMNKNRTIGSSSVGKTLPNIQSLVKEYDIDFEYENVFEHSPDSTNIGETEWDILFNKIKFIIECKKAVKEKKISKELYPLDDSVGGIVVSHGTDTLQLTSLMLALRLSLNELFFPIIFTGSFTTIDDDRNDVENNLTKAIYAAKPCLSADPSRRLPPQIYVLIGEEVHLATRTTKVYTTQNTEGKYFFSYPFPVARITASTPIKKLIHQKETLSVENLDVEKWRQKVRKEKITLCFDSDYFDELLNSHSSNGWKLAKYFIKEKDCWATVEHIIINKYLAKESLKALTQRVYEYKIKNNPCDSYGIVIQGNFSKRADFDEVKDIIKVLAIDAVIFVGSKDVYDRLMDIKNVGLIPKSLSYQKARTKLSFLLKLNLKKSEIIRFMGENIAGEIANFQQFPDWVQYENYPDLVEAIPVYPNIKKEVYLHAIQQVAKLEKTRRVINLYGYGNGHIPTINIPISKCVCDFLNSDMFKFETINKMEDSNDVEGEILEKVISIIDSSLGIIHKYIDKYYCFVKNINNLQQNDLTADYIGRHKKNIAKIIIRDSLMRNSDVLMLLGEAVESGISIGVKTSAQAKTNHSQYPVGRILLAIGINSDEQSGWTIKELKMKEYKYISTAD